MLQVVIPGERMGHQFKAGNPLVKGTVAYISGIDTSGYFILQYPTNSTTAALAVYPFNKYYYLEHYSDTSDAVNIIASGDPLVVYKGGEYITDKIVGVGGSTSNAYFWTGHRFSTPAGAMITVTDTAGYTEGAGKMVYLFPSTAAATRGWLRVSTAHDTITAGLKACLNRNFLLVRAFGRGWSGDCKAQFRVIATDAFAGRINITSTSLGGGATSYPTQTYNVSTISV